MIDNMFGFLREQGYSQIDQFVTVLLVVVALIFFFGYSCITASKRGKSLFWIVSILCVIVLGSILGVYLWRIPHGLSGSYYDNPSWEGKPVDSMRYFETPGQRVDRFIDFNANDFNDRYPFSEQPFGITWQGWVYVPDDDYQLGVRSNLGTWLYVDNELIDGHYRIDFGTPEARTYLREGWSVDEQWGIAPFFRFIWSSGSRSEFYLGVDEPADYSLVFRCMPFSYEGSAPQELLIHVNGVPLEPSVMLKNGWNTYTVPVPHSVIQENIPGFSRIKFTYSHVIRPSDVVEQLRDKRELAVAFDFALLQKSSNQPVVTSVAQQSRSLSRGFHRITLKACQNQGEVDSFVQLIWKKGELRRPTVISEDYLFPKTFVPEISRQVVLKERIFLGLLILYKLCIIALLGSVILISVVPCYFSKLFTREILFILVLGVLAFGIRFFFLLEIKDTDPDFYRLLRGTDQLNYVFFARGFFRGYWPALTHEPFFQAPFISFYFILVSVLFGENLFTLRLVTTVIATGSIFLVFLIARQVFNRTVAYIAAILCACNGVLIFYDTSLLIAPLVTFLNLLALWLMLRLKEGLSLKIMLVLGVVLGVTTLARANIFLLMPFLFFWMLFDVPGYFWHKIFHYILLVFIILLTILPVTLRNYLSDSSHPFVLTNTNGGITFWIGNNPSSTGLFEYSRKLLRKTKSRMKETGSSYADEVFRYIQEQPLDYLKLEYKKFKMFWRGYENGNLLPYYFFRENYSKILKFPWLNFVIIGPLGIVGMFFTIKRWRTRFLLYSFVCVQILTTLLFFALARYRLPVVPVLSMFAAYMLWKSVQRFQQKQWGQLGMTIGLFAIFYFLCNVPYAMEVYRTHYDESMPLINIFRYWDLFHIQL